MKTNEQLIQEMIEKVDKETMLEILSHTNENPGKSNINIDWHLKTWATNKLPIYITMGETLKKSVEIECELSESQIRTLICDLCERFREKLPFAAALFSRWRELKPADIIENRFPKDITILGQKFQAGSRLSKAVSKLSLDGEAVNLFQIELSKVIQSMKGQGKAILSIDPIDYLTMSANNSGWRSCHNIINGEFRGGCLSYMCDKSTAIAYATLNSKATIGSAQFDNKMWRQCIYFSKDMDFAVQSRQYPNVNKNNRKAISSIINEMLGGNLKPVVKDVYDGDGDVYGFNRSIVKDVNGYNALHYNDVLRGSFKQYVLMVDHDVEPNREWANNVGYCEVGWDIKAIDDEFFILEDSDRICAYDNCEDNEEW